MSEKNFFIIEIKFVSVIFFIQTLENKSCNRHSILIFASKD